ncbi:hypothetical protein FRC02_010514 [Tulasnella sp. 418]|nr:hypothetical protein FRC02_010514 [Tulasnella sp. 418]
MPFSSKTLPTYIQCTAYVANYPFPAFALSKRHAGKMATDLRVIYANAPWRELMMGPHVDQPLRDTLLEALYDEEDGICSIKEAKRFGEWVENTHSPRIETVHTGYLRPSWLPDEEPTVQLDFIRTDIDNFYVITTVPRTPLPKYSPDMAKSSLPEPSTSSITAIKREASATLKLENLPSTQFPRRFTPNTSPNTVNEPPVVPDRPLEPPIPRDSEMKRMVENYPWHTTSLGPRSSWPASLNTALSYVLNCPYKAALWWGEEMILFYNDAYAAMVGVKHPGSFAQKGSLAWAEMWNSLGPLTETVKQGNSVAKQDDLMFMDKLTDARLPEETYHSWSWTPVIQEDGSYGGFINATFETTEKIISARRLHTLREFGDKVAAATTTAQYAKACMEAFKSNVQDIPFAAVYLTASGATGKTHVQYGPPADNDGEGRPLRVSIKLAGSIGIPDDNTTAMRYMELLLDQSTLDPVPVAIKQEVRNFVSNPDRPSTKASTVEKKPGTSETTGTTDLLRNGKVYSVISNTPSPASTVRPPFLDKSPSIYSESSIARGLPSNSHSEQTISRNVARLTRLVDSLMQFSRIEAGRLKGKFRLLELGALTADLAVLFRNTIEKSQIEYVIDCETREVPATYVDVDFWEKIVFNLIGNAFKYTMAGAVYVTTRYTKTHFEFTIRDTGVGIPAEDLDKIFDRFHRVESVSRSHEGTGIGLSLTKELVGLHGGTISVESNNGTGDSEHGSAFTVSIPLGKDHLPRDCIDNRSIAEGPFARRSYAKGYVEEATQWSFGNFSNEETTSSEIYESGQSDGARSNDLSSMYQFQKSDIILLVDDNSDVRKFIRTIFEKYCKVAEAADGRDAMQKILAKRPHLVISDVMMPQVDGMELLSMIKTHQDPKISQIPVVLLTARAGDEARVDGLLAGADDYISKPFKGRELVARAHLQIQLGKRKAELQALYETRKTELQLLMDMSPVGIFRVDSKGQMTYVNKRLLNITGPLITSWMEGRLDRTSLDERTRPLSLGEWLLNVHDEYAQETSALCNDVLMHGESGSLEIRWKNEKWTKIQVEPIGGAYTSRHLRLLRVLNFFLDGLIGTVTDVSDRHLYEEAQIFRAKEREALAKHRAIEAEEREKEADQRRRAQELLVDVTSHELRQPVSAILNCSALVRGNLASLYDKLLKCIEEALPFTPSRVLLNTMDDDLEALDAIYQCGLAQERIANDVLSLSRLQLQILSIHPVDFDIVLEVRRILSIFSNELKMKKIELSITFEKSLEQFGISYVSADKARFAQVVTNLLSNAIKFTDTSPPPNRRIHVFVNVSPRPPAAAPCVPPMLSDNEIEKAKERFKVEPWEDVYIYIAVSDSGPGLKPNDLALLFQRFQQGSNSDNVFGGSGLGLFVSRKLCDLMGGNIDVDSVYGQGATFRFYIRAKVAPEPTPATQAAISSGEVGSREEREARSDSSTSELSSAGSITSRIEAVRRQQQGVLESLAPLSQTQFHVLITEDNMINQTVLNRQLKKAGFKTTLASNGKQAIEQIMKLQKKGEDEGDGRGWGFDCILMDCEMPVMDGLTATREIRRMELAGELSGRNRIIALTGNARSGRFFDRECCVVGMLR